MLVLANELGLAGEAAKPVALLEAEIAALGTYDRRLALQLEAMLAGVGRSSAETHRRTRLRLARLEPQLREDGPADRLVLANLAFQQAIEGESAQRACALAERALGNGRLLTEVGADGMAFYFAVNALCYADRYDAVEQHLRAALADAHRSGSLLGFALASGFRAMAAYRRGLLSEAEADARAAIGAFAEGDLALLAYVHAQLANTLVQIGDLDAAEGALAPIPPLAAAVGRQPLVWALQARAHLRLAQGRPREALEEAVGSSRACSWGTASPSFLDWRSSAALAELALGERELARSLAREELTLARAFGAPRAIGIALRTRALAEDDPDRAVGLLCEAERLLAACGARLEHARALTARGAALRRANRRREAREPLLAALELANRCGARMIEEHARVELAAAGARPRRPARSGIDALTPSELRVARMAAEGMTNKAIAQALFVTHKTVETHLGHVYGKLGVRSRAELALTLSPN